MITLSAKGQVPVEWEVVEPNFDGKVHMKVRKDGVVVDTWTVGPAYYLLVMDLAGTLHTLSSREVRIIPTQTHINRRNDQL